MYIDWNWSSKDSYNVYRSTTYWHSTLQLTYRFCACCALLTTSRVTVIQDSSQEVTKWKSHDNVAKKLGEERMDLVESDWALPLEYSCH